MFSLHSCYLFAVAAIFTRIAIAAPFTLESRAVSADVYSNLQLFEQFTAAAYCSTNNNSTGNKLTCSNNLCPRVEGADTKTVLEFQNSLITDVTGYVAIDDTDQLVVVAFRGSSSIRNYLADANFPFVLTDICSGCFADSGFYTSWLEARDGVMAAIKNTSLAFPDYKIVVTGHSLGGAIAALATGELRNDGYQAALYTYGSPRVGNAALSTYITNQPGGNYRVTHYNDPVPRLPPQLLGYTHISPEYYIDTPNQVAVTANDIEVYQGITNSSGNARWGLNQDANAHTWYFNNVSSCDPSTFEFRKRASLSI